MDERVVKKIEELTRNYVRKTAEMKRHLEIFILSELFRGRRPPAKTRRRFYPTNKDITNIMQKAKSASRHSQMDQENLDQMISEWRTTSPDDNFFFRHFKENKAEETKQNLLFVYQSKDQKRLLRIYGNQMTLLDATYRTTKYALPLFFLCVRTNVSYQVVASFVTQDEDNGSISEALRIVKEWNPEWQPRYTMVDFDQAEITALEEVFPGTNKNDNASTRCLQINVSILNKTQFRLNRPKSCFTYKLDSFLYDTKRLVLKRVCSIRLIFYFI